MSFDREYYESGETLGSEDGDKANSNWFSLLQTRRFIASSVAIIIFFTGTMFTLKEANPDLFYKLMVSFDSINGSANSKYEKKRISHIAILPISSEKQQMLINHKIFIGAAQQMVKLSLGEPIIKNQYANNIAQWTYNRPKDNNTITILEFKDNKLIKTYNERTSYNN